MLYGGKITAVENSHMLLVFLHSMHKHLLPQCKNGTVLNVKVVFEDVQLAEKNNVKVMLEIVQNEKKMNKNFTVYI